MSPLPLSGQVCGIKGSLHRGPNLQSHSLHNCRGIRDWLDRILCSPLSHRDTNPECLLKQNITSLVGSRAHHSFPWSSQNKFLTKLL